MTIRRKILLMLIAFSVIPVLIITVLGLVTNISTVESLHVSRLSSLANNSSSALGKIVHLHKEQVRLLSISQTVTEYLSVMNMKENSDTEALEKRDALSRDFEAFINTFGVFDDLVLLDTEGTVLAGYHPQTLGLSLKEMEYFSYIINESEKDDIYVSKVVNSLVSPDDVNAKCLAISKALWDNENKLQGVLVAYVNANVLANFTQSVSFGETGLAFVIDSENYILFHPESRFFNSYTVAPALTNLWVRYKVGEIPPEGRISAVLDEIPRIYYYKAVEGEGLILILRQDYSEYTRDRNASILFFAVAITVTLFIAVLLGLRFSNEFVRPILKLKNAFASAQEEGMYIICDIDEKNEIGDMAISYNAMINRLLLLDKDLRSNYQLLGSEQEKTKHLAEQLRKSLEHQTTTLSTIYTAIPDLVFCKDANGIYTSCNPSFEKFVGLNNTEIIGKNDMELFKIDSEMARLFVEADVKVLNGEGLSVMEEWLTYPDESRKLFETIKAPLLQDGVIIGIVGISRDITQRKMTEDMAHVASEAKSAFLAHMSHEIRTPLNAIIGMAGIAKNSIADQEKALVSINQVITSSHHLLGILNNVLDMSKIESGKMELICEPFSLLASYREVLGIIKYRCIEKSIDLTNDIDEMEDVSLIGDKLRVNQVMLNLLSNAVKFADIGGKVDCSIKKIHETEKFIKYRFMVSDDGIGMSEEQLSKLFVPFEQTEANIAVLYGGTGLGLSISQNLVNIMGGTIEVESKLGIGTKFFFELSFEKNDMNIHISSDDSPVIDMCGNKILVVEDVEINRIIVCEILSEMGIEIHEAEDGKQALDMFEKMPENYFDLILMDIQMPEMNGYEATEQIRGLEREDARIIPIVAMTANAYKEDIEKALAVGMNAHVAKPIDVDILFETLKNTKKPSNI